jgi:hypothetical protein
MVPAFVPHANLLFGSKQRHKMGVSISIVFKHLKPFIAQMLIRLSIDAVANR